MDESGRRWFAPAVRQLVGPDQLALSRIFGSLTEYFRRTVGVWQQFSGTTDVSGHLTVAHGAPFFPSVVLITERHSGVGHVEGPYHVLSVDKDNVTVHFLTSTIGNDRSNVNVVFDMLCLP